MDMMSIERLFYAVPLGLDSGLDSLCPDEDAAGQSLPPQFYSYNSDFIQGAMTQLHPRYEDQNNVSWQAATAQSSNERRSSRPHDAARYPRPGRQSHGGSLDAAAGASYHSMSPSAASLILTPDSTLLDHHDGSAYDDQDSDNYPTSPASGSISNTMDDSEHNSDGEVQGGQEGRRMSRQPPLSGVHPHRLGHTSRQRESSAPHQPSNQGHQWVSNSFNSVSGMEDTYMPYGSSADMVFSTDAFADDQQASAYGSGLDATSLQSQPYGSLPFRHHDEIDPRQVSPLSYANTSLLPQQQVFRQHAGNYVDQGFAQPNMNAAPFAPAPHFQNNFNTPGFGYPAQAVNQRTYPQFMQQPMQQTRRRPVQAPMINTTMQPVRNVPITSGLRSSQAYLYQQQQQHLVGPMSPVEEKPKLAKHQPSTAKLSHQDVASTSNVIARRPLQKADQAPAGTLRTQSPTRIRKGGRQKNSHLAETSRVKSHAMRKVGACWRCALQRDPCDEGTPCTRCQVQMQRGQIFYFPCSRSKLPDFVHDLLPPSLTLMHSKQSIEDTVSQEVRSWDEGNAIDVYLGSGYGPPLVWKLYEFEPKTPELLSQLQFYRDEQTGQCMSRFKYSPPFGMLKIDTSDEAHLEAYLDALMEPDVLWDFGQTFYEEESELDEEMFLADLLRDMCDLFLATNEVPLKAILKDILRMIIITFIMGHTLTIEKGTLPTVLSRVRRSSRPPSIAPHTSPRLANRQLKFFFAILREKIYEKILKWQQQNLHAAGKKDQTWLQAFCVMLGFAMVLEEMQRLLQIQADAVVQKGEIDAESSNVQAKNACERIDERFQLLVGLFQCKYRDKKWGDRGSFGPSTPELREECQVYFCGKVRRSLEQNYRYLQFRQSVPFAPENQCLYTGRLTARFLLPFLNLPG